MARHERDFRPSTEEPIGHDELRALIGGHQEAVERKDAIACFLSASEGWQQARGLIGGAFAATEAELKERKGD